MIRPPRNSDDPYAGQLFWSRRGGRDLSAEVDYDRPCPVCGYNLRGMPIKSRCPECGATGGWAIDDEPIAWDERQTIGAFLRTVLTILFQPRRLARHVWLKRRLNLQAAQRFRRINLTIATASLCIATFIITTNVVGWAIAVCSLFFQLAAIVLWLNAVTLQPMSHLKVWTGESSIFRRVQVITYYFSASFALSIIHVASPILWCDKLDIDAWLVICAIHLAVLSVQLLIASRGLGWLLYELVDMPRFEAHMVAMGWVIAASVGSIILVLVPLGAAVVMKHLLGSA